MAAETQERDGRVGVVYDSRMCGHECEYDEDHPEKPERVRAIWEKLSPLRHRCVLLPSAEATEDDLRLVHTPDHINLITSTIASSKSALQRRRIASNFNSIYFNPHSSSSALLAAGSVLRVAHLVASGELESGVAIVRPPGHHAEADQPMGFCLFNNVAVAAASLLRRHPRLKILIVDWDVHHGNATQKMFWKDPRVLFFSVHRHDHGSFYPASDDGFYTMVGAGAGAGYNINVPWEHARVGDADYLAVWDHVLLPVATQFHPNIILVSAGFDAAVGDPLGGCRLTPYGYSLMLKKLMNFANGKIVLVLEGGYNLESIANSMYACVQILLHDKIADAPSSSQSYPFESTWRVIQAVRKQLSSFWPMLADELPKELTSATTHITPTFSEASFSSSNSDADADEEAPNATSDHFEEVLQSIVEPLSMIKLNEGTAGGNSETWRVELSKTDVWYASFGSNMWQPRFMCYIKGGQVDGMQKPFSGSADKTPPKEIAWESFPHRLFFGRESTLTWGPGGVAFVNPEITAQQDKTYMCLYRITLEQLNDVLLQENTQSTCISSPVLDLAALNSFTSGKSNYLEVDLERGWYRNVVCLGKKRDIPILTMTCSFSEMESFKSGEVPLRGPSEGYAKTLARGLVQGNQFSQLQAAMEYIQQAVSTPLF